MGKRASKKGEIEIKRVRILLDAGHYADYNQSPVVKQYWESRRMWRLCEYIETELLSYGFEVSKTREDPEKDLAVTKRGKMAKDCDMFISLHSNASSSPKTDRVDVYASYDNINDSHSLGLRFAKAIAEIMKVSDGYVKTRKSSKGDWEYYGVLRGAREVGCPLYYLIEHSFHTNEKAALWLLDDVNLKILAMTEAYVVASYFGMLKQGDVNGDGKIDFKDAELVKKSILGSEKLDSDAHSRADVNSDGKVNMFDYIVIKNK